MAQCLVCTAHLREISTVPLAGFVSGPQSTAGERAVMQ